MIGPPSQMRAFYADHRRRNWVCRRHPGQQSRRKHRRNHRRGSETHRDQRMGDARQGAGILQLAGVEEARAATRQGAKDNPAVRRRKSELGLPRASAQRAISTYPVPAIMSGSTNSGLGPHCEIDAMGRKQPPALQKRLAHGRTYSPDRDRLSIQP